MGVSRGSQKFGGCWGSAPWDVAWLAPWNNQRAKFGRSRSKRMRTRGGKSLGDGRWGVADPI